MLKLCKFTKEILYNMLDNYNEKQVCRAYSIKNKKGYDSDKIGAINDELEQLSCSGLIILGKKDFGVYNNIRLNKETVPVLIREIGWKKKEDKTSVILDIIKKHETDCAKTKSLCEILKENLPKYKTPEKIDNALSLFSAIMMNNSPVYIRVLSQRILGDTKKFKSEYLDCIIKWIYMLDPYLETETNSIKILEQWQVYDTPVYIYVKGNGKIFFSESGGNIIIDLCRLRGGIGISGDDIYNIERVEIYDNNIITIENWTSYQQFNKDDFFCFYLGGFSTRPQEEFIKRFFPDEKQLYHFGDIDRGGLWIFLKLCERTSKDFITYHMNISDLEIYKDFSKPLSNEEIEGLKKIKATYAQFAELIDFMCEKKIKLEQEIIEL